jgi:hypothetical protein
MRRRLAVAVLAALVLAPIAQAAARAPVFGLRAVGNPKRGFFIYPLSPGGERRGAVIVSNTGTAAGTVRLFTADATTGDTTGTVYETEKRPSRAGGWIALATNRVTLRPGQHRTVAFVVHVPKRAGPGQWVGGIVAESTHRVRGPSSKQKARVQINIRDLTIVAVQVDVPGREFVSIRVGAVTTGGQRGFQQVITHFVNAGNVLVKPTGTITLTRGAATVQTLPFKMDTFLPLTAIDYPVLLKHALAPGAYTAVVSLRVPASASVKAATIVSARRPLAVSKQDVQQVFTTATPQAPPPGAKTSSGGGSSLSGALVAAVAGGVLAVALLSLLLVRRRRSAPASAGDAPEAAPAVTAADRTAPPARVPELETAPQAGHCDHLWDVAYHHARLGDDGVWRFPHRCRACGRDLLAADVADANSHAAVR